MASCFLALGLLVSMGRIEPTFGEHRVAALTYRSTAADECTDCRGTRVCRAHRSLETKRLKVLKAALASKDAKERIAALSQVAALTDAHHNVPGRAVAVVPPQGLGNKTLPRQRHAGLVTQFMRQSVAHAFTLLHTAARQMPASDIGMTNQNHLAIRAPDNPAHPQRGTASKPPEGVPAGEDDGVARPTPVAAAATERASFSHSSCSSSADRKR